MLIVVIFYLVPYKFSCLGIHHINESLLTIEIEGSILTVFGSDEHVSLAHFKVVFALWIDGRPDGDYRMNIHLFKLFYHRGRVWPIFRVEFPFTLFSPVEVINYNGINRDSLLFIFTSYS